MNDENPDIKPCHCCGQLRPYPTTPGRWRYRDIVWGGGWTNVTAAACGEGLTITPDGESEPIWWPNNAQWEKIED